ncbi:MAG: flagellar motor protein MotB [Planctomycetota bacterium]|jgi:outer membrane protein OmpA-like peptidoglycan-associated protein
MAKKKKIQGDGEGPNVPTWIVSFSDMITLLLSFFVLLQTCTRVRSEELFLVGQGSFRAAVRGLGIPTWLLGRRSLPKLKHSRSFFIPEEKDKDEEIRNEVFDADDEKIRAAFKEMQRQMTTEASDLQLKQIDLKGFQLTFTDEGDGLSSDDRRQLVALAERVRAAVIQRRVSVYVIGFAIEDDPDQRGLVISAERAGAVEQFLRRQFASEIKQLEWDIFSWGAGEGQRLAQSMGIDVDKTSVAVAIMGAYDDHE